MSDLNTFKQSREILRAAKLKAQKIVERSVKNASSIRKEYQNKGFSEGLEKFLVLLAEFEKRKDNLELKYKKELTLLATNIAKEVIAEELKTSPESIYSRVERAFRYIKSPRKIRLIVNPEMLPYLKKIKDMVVKSFPEDTSFSILVNEDLKRGSAIIETPNGTVITEPFSHLESIKTHISKLNS